MFSIEAKKKPRTNAVAFTLILFSYCFINNTYATDPEYHRILTKKAIAFYRHCIEQLDTYDTLSDGADVIAEYSKLEDISPLITRLLNWHFYDAYRGTEHEMGFAIIGARKSMHHIFSAHERKLIQAIEDNDKHEIFEYTGRILHLIQDMTVPAHVAPIYHYKFFFFDNSDSFDEMQEWGNTSFTITEDLCAIDEVDTSDITRQLELVLDETALSTRARLKEEIPISKDHRLAGKTWEEFWVIRDPDDDSSYSGTYSGFAPYGNEGNIGFRKLCESPGNGRRACLDFFQRSYDSAINSTVETLLLLNSVVAGKES